MVKDFLLARAAASRSPIEVQLYMQFKHAPLVLSTPIGRRLLNLYTMNHVIGGPDQTCSLYPAFPGVISVVEQGLIGGDAAVQALLVDDDYLTKIVPDEKYIHENMLGERPDFVMVEESRIIFVSEPTGSTRMFDFVRRPAGMSAPTFLSKLEDDGLWAQANPEYRSAVSKRVHSLVGTGLAPVHQDSEAVAAVMEPFDAVIELSISDTDALSRLVEEQRARRASFCDPGRSFSVLTRGNHLYSQV
jgi:hypothetical protein